MIIFPRGENARQSSGPKRKLNKTLDSTTCGARGPYVEVKRVEVPYAAGFDMEVETSESSGLALSLRGNAAAQAQENQDDQDMRPAEDDESTTWKWFSTHFHDDDGKLHVLHGLHVDFKRRLAHEVWQTGVRKTWKMDQRWNNDTWCLLEMLWNQTERKVWVQWKIATSESEIKKWKVTTITTSEELDDLARIASSE